jgi:DNA polymerase elongation subunit (family B)
MKGNRKGDYVEVCFPHERGVVPSFCEYLVAERSKYKRSDRSRYESIKVINNSVYGSLCFPLYLSYSPYCASVVTGAGRWALTLMRVVADKLCTISDHELLMKAKIIYGDTDSVFIESRSTYGLNSLLKVKALGLKICSISSLILSFTCLGKLNPDPTADDSGNSVYKSMILLAPKMYIRMDSCDRVEAKGVASVRRGGCKMLNNLEQSIISKVLLSSGGFDEDDKMIMVTDVFKTFYSILYEGTRAASYICICITRYGLSAYYYWSKRNSENPDGRVFLDPISSAYKSSISSLQDKPDIGMYKQLIINRADKLTRCIDRNVSF